jgi:hypothetical protein
MLPLILILFILTAGFSWHIYGHFKIERLQKTLNTNIHNAEAKMFLGHTVVMDIHKVVNKLYLYQAHANPQEKLWLNTASVSLDEIDRAL